MAKQLHSTSYKLSFIQEEKYYFLSSNELSVDFLLTVFPVMNLLEIIYFVIIENKVAGVLSNFPVTSLALSYILHVTWIENIFFWKKQCMYALIKLPALGYYRANCCNVR